MTSSRQRCDVLVGRAARRSGRGRRSPCRRGAGSTRGPWARPSSVAARSQSYPLVARSNVIPVADLRIVPITPARLGDLDTLFARGDPRTCQCAYLRLTHRDYAHSSPAEHRDVHHRAVRRAARAKRAAGMIAYDDAGPVGWVSFGPRERVRPARRLAGAAAGGRRGGDLGGLLRDRPAGPAAGGGEGPARRGHRVRGGARHRGLGGVPGRPGRRASARARSCGADRDGSTRPPASPSPPPARPTPPPGRS